MVSRMPPTSPAGTRLTNSSSKTFGWRLSASLNVAPCSTVSLTSLRIALKALLSPWLDEDVEALHERQTGVDHRREQAGEDDEVLRRDRAIRSRA